MPVQLDQPTDFARLPSVLSLPFDLLTYYETRTHVIVVATNALKEDFRILQFTKSNTKLSYVFDPSVYKRDQAVAYVNRMKGMDTHAASSANTNGALLSSGRARGIIGFVRFLKGYYMVLLKDRRLVTRLGPHSIYEVQDTTIVSLCEPAVGGLFTKLRSDDEDRYLAMFKSFDLKRYFYYSDTYDLTNTLQTNMTRPHNVMRGWEKKARCEVERKQRELDEAAALFKQQQQQNNDGDGVASPPRPTSPLPEAIDLANPAPLAEDGTSTIRDAPSLCPLRRSKFIWNHFLLLPTRDTTLYGEEGLGVDGQPLGSAGSYDSAARRAAEWRAWVVPLIHGCISEADLVRTSSQGLDGAVGNGSPANMGGPAANSLNDPNASSNGVAGGASTASSNNPHLINKSPIKVLLIGRSSKKFAGTRYLKRGINGDGYVANHVEVEQIVYDPSTLSKCDTMGAFSSFVQVRGSVPVSWYHPPVNRPKPPIVIGFNEPLYGFTRKHMEDLLEDFGAPIVVVNLLKSAKAERKKSREKFLSEEYQKALLTLATIAKPANALTNHPVNVEVSDVNDDGSITHLLAVPPENPDGPDPHRRPKRKLFATDFIKGEEEREAMLLRDHLEAHVPSHLNQSSSRGGTSVMNSFVAMNGANSTAATPNNALLFGGAADAVTLEDLKQSSFVSEVAGGGGASSSVGTSCDDTPPPTHIRPFAETLSLPWRLLQYVEFDLRNSSDKAWNCMTSIAESRIPQVGLFSCDANGAVQGLQCGVLRSNCVDCIDRTNLGQFFFGLHAIGSQLKAIGVLKDGTDTSHSEGLSELVLELYLRLGDAIAIQYGGSAQVGAGLLHRGLGWDKIMGIRRLYTNLVVDKDRQQVTNVFLGLYTPMYRPDDGAVSSGGVGAGGRGDGRANGDAVVDEGSTYYQFRGAIPAVGRYGALSYNTSGGAGGVGDSSDGPNQQRYSPTRASVAAPRGMPPASASASSNTASTATSVAFFRSANRDSSAYSNSNKMAIPFQVHYERNFMGKVVSATVDKDRHVDIQDLESDYYLHTSAPQPMERPARDWWRLPLIKYHRRRDPYFATAYSTIHNGPSPCEVLSMSASSPNGSPTAANNGLVGYGGAMTMSAETSVNNFSSSLPTSPTRIASNYSLRAQNANARASGGGGAGNTSTTAYYYNNTSRADLRGSTTRTNAVKMPIPPSFVVVDHSGLIREQTCEEMENMASQVYTSIRIGLDEGVYEVEKPIPADTNDVRLVCSLAVTDSATTNAVKRCPYLNIDHRPIQRLSQSALVLNPDPSFVTQRPQLHDFSTFAESIKESFFAAEEEKYHSLPFWEGPSPPRKYRWNFDDPSQNRPRKSAFAPHPTQLAEAYKGTKSTPWEWRNKRMSNEEVQFLATSIYHHGSPLDNDNDWECEHLCLVIRALDPDVPEEYIDMVWDVLGYNSSVYFMRVVPNDAFGREYTIYTDNLRRIFNAVHASLTPIALLTPAQDTSMAAFSAHQHTTGAAAFLSPAQQFSMDLALDPLERMNYQLEATVVDYGDDGKAKTIPRPAKHYVDAIPEISPYWTYSEDTKELLCRAVSSLRLVQPTVSTFSRFVDPPLDATNVEEVLVRLMLELTHPITGIPLTNCKRFCRPTVENPLPVAVPMVNVFSIPTFMSWLEENSAACGLKFHRMVPRRRLIAMRQFADLLVNSGIVTKVDVPVPGATGIVISSTMPRDYEDEGVLFTFANVNGRFPLNVNNVGKDHMMLLKESRAVELSLLIAMRQFADLLVNSGIVTKVDVPVPGATGIVISSTMPRDYEDEGVLFTFANVNGRFPLNVSNANKDHMMLLKESRAVELSLLIATTALALLKNYEDFLSTSNGRERFRELPRLTAVTAYLQGADITTLCVEERICFFINVYNALYIHSWIQAHQSNRTTSMISFYQTMCYNIGNHMYSLHDIKHGILRGNTPSSLMLFPQFLLDDARKVLSIGFINELTGRIVYALIDTYVVHERANFVNSYNAGAKKSLHSDEPMASGSGAGEGSDDNDSSDEEGEENDDEGGGSSAKAEATKKRTGSQKDQRSSTAAGRGLVSTTTHTAGGGIVGAAARVLNDVPWLRNQRKTTEAANICRPMDPATLYRQLNELEIQFSYRTMGWALPGVRIQQANAMSDQSLALMGGMSTPMSSDPNVSGSTPLSSNHRVASAAAAAARGAVGSGPSPLRGRSFSTAHGDEGGAGSLHPSELPPEIVALRAQQQQSSAAFGMGLQSSAALSSSATMGGAQSNAYFLTNAAAHQELPREERLKIVQPLSGLEEFGAEAEDILARIERIAQSHHERRNKAATQRKNAAAAAAAKAKMQQQYQAHREQYHHGSTATHLTGGHLY